MNSISFFQCYACTSRLIAYVLPFAWPNVLSVVTKKTNPTRGNWQAIELFVLPLIQRCVVSHTLEGEKVVFKSLMILPFLNLEKRG
jgi:hypothetical protein